MQDWQARNMWNTDPDSAFEEAERRIAMCAESNSDRLYLGDVKLDRLPPAISSLTWLREVDLYGSPISDYTSIAPLTNLRSLKVGSLHAAFPGLQFVRGWRELRELVLISPAPLDLAPLASCVLLTRLNISCSQHKVTLHNLDALKELRALEQLSLYNMQSDRFDVIGEWRALTFVQLLHANLTSLAGFENLRKVEYVSIWGAPVSDLSPLSDLPELRRLDASESNAHDLTPLSSVSTLEELNIAHTRVSDLRPLADLARLQSTRNHGGSKHSHPARGLTRIDLAGCPVADLTPLSGFEQLGSVDLSDTLVTSLTPLHRHKTLDSLRLAGAPVRDLGPPGALSELGFLAAPNTLIQDLSALAPASRLQGVDIAHTSISDLRPLRAARNCRTLMLRGSQVRDLAPILETGSQEEDHRYSPQHLDFRDTPAARADARLAGLAAIAESDPHKCFVDTKRHLKAQAEAGRLGRSRLTGWLLGPNGSDSSG